MPKGPRLPWCYPDFPDVKGWHVVVFTRGPNDKKFGQKYRVYYPPRGNAIRSLKQAKYRMALQSVWLQAAAKAQDKAQDKAQVSLSIHGKDDPRKKTARHGIKMVDGEKCPLCDWNIYKKNGQRKNNSAFAMHITNNHKKEAGISDHLYQCKICDVSFKSRSILNNHNESKHQPSTLKSSLCDCGFQPRNKSSLLIHLVSKHLHKKNSDCITHDGRCVNCYELLPNTGHKYHYAVCIGLHSSISS